MILTIVVFAIIVFVWMCWRNFKDNINHTLLRIYRAAFALRKGLDEAHASSERIISDIDYYSQEISKYEGQRKADIINILEENGKSLEINLKRVARFTLLLKRLDDIVNNNPVLLFVHIRKSIEVLKEKEMQKNENAS